MTKIRYVGPLPAVTIPAAAGVTVAHGEEVDVPAKVAESLLAQDAFEPAGTPAKKAATKKAAARADASSPTTGSAG